MAEGKDLAQANEHKDGRKWIQFAKWFLYEKKFRIYQEGIN